MSDFLIGILAVIVMILPFVLLVFVLSRVFKNKKALTPEERERKRAEREAEREAEKDAKRKSHIIMEVKLLDGGSNIRKRAGLGGAVVGGMVAGPAGAIVGASMKKAGKKNRQRFAVRYADGHITTVEAEPGSDTYNKLMRYVKWEEIN